MAAIRVKLIAPPGQPETHVFVMTDKIKTFTEQTDGSTMIEMVEGDSVHAAESIDELKTQVDAQAPAITPAPAGPKPTTRM